MIVSNNSCNAFGARIVVPPLASNVDSLVPGKALVTENGKPARALGDQIRSLDNSRLRPKIERLSQDELAGVEEAVRITLALRPEMRFPWDSTFQLLVRELLRRTLYGVRFSWVGLWRRRFAGNWNHSSAHWGLLVRPLLPIKKVDVQGSEPELIRRRVGFASRPGQVKPGAEGRLVEQPSNSAAQFESLTERL
jgi:mRNA-degrading endonuclease toxin of MazEF toxin-antitoxin module